MYMFMYVCGIYSCICLCIDEFACVLLGLSENVIGHGEQDIKHHSEFRRHSVFWHGSSFQFFEVE